MYPILFNPIYKEMIWGGQNLTRMFNRVLPFKKVGESWDVSMRPNEMSIVSNGIYAGQTFERLIKSEGGRAEWLGRDFKEDAPFPLLVKIIDANNNLSVQVHPNDEQAKFLSNEISGKNEMWYILQAPENAGLIIGLKDGAKREMLREALESGDAEQYFSYLPVKPGDVIHIPAGLLHAITAGVMAAEIQQNSDITYRVYDYNRVGPDGKPRQLHIKKALDVIDFDNRLKKIKISGLETHDGDTVYYIANPYFCVILYQFKHIKYLREISDPNKFFIYTCLKGSCVIKHQNRETPLITGGSVFIPAGLGEFEIVSDSSDSSRILKSFIPNIDKDFIEPLLKAGYTIEKIFRETSVSY
ncbi:MAG: class I mannose-6-phosphate isomerase [Clostridiales bacterium]|jgi:mannose-6-phosphate isomerase|nr:class I mannose-6-phosphate isomerase [Clostridiales bacterium]